MQLRHAFTGLAAGRAAHGLAADGDQCRAAGSASFRCWRFTEQQRAGVAAFVFNLILPLSVLRLLLTLDRISHSLAETNTQLQRSMTLYERAFENNGMASVICRGRWPHCARQPAGRRADRTILRGAGGRQSGPTLAPAWTSYVMPPSLAVSGICTAPTATFAWCVCMSPRCPSLRICWYP